MFTGLIAAKGTILALKKKQQTIQLTIGFNQLDSTNLKVGDSIAVNGVCLTTIHFTTDFFVAECMPETYQVTNLSALQIRDFVNLERALPINGRLEGHLVAGHVDSTTKFIRKQKKQNALLYTFALPATLSEFIVTKGSIAIDGVSLTIIEVTQQTFIVGLIPHSQKETTLDALEIGALVNLEVDLIGRYIVKNLVAQPTSTTIHYQKLIENGFG